FHIDSMGDGTCFMRTWNEKYVYLDEKDGNVIKFKDEFKDLLEEKFIIEKLEDGIERACKTAKDCDVVVVCVGNNPVVNGKEDVDRVDISLPDYQEKLIRELYKVNPNLVLLVISSYPYAINWAKDHIPAILWSSHGGQEMGNAIADILIGEYSPAGRLNMTWYKSISDIPPITDYDIIRGKRTYVYFDKEPLFPFGHGLSYTEFQYKNLSLNSKEFKIGDEIKVRFEVENIGNMDSDEVVQVYVRALASKVNRPKLQLKGFKRILIPKGESIEVEISIPISELFIWDVRKERYLIEKGRYEILVGSSSKDIRLREEIYVDGEEIENRNPFSYIKAINFDDYKNIVLKTKRDFKETYVDFVSDDSWILFKDLEFKTSSNKIEIEISSSKPSNIILYFDNIKREIPLDILDTQNEWKSFQFELPDISGLQNMSIKAKGVSISCFKFI
ncbi:MAG TPA: glycoside hydrolase family 3 C-terminal domain-containing protein, partial [Dictyoglomaceae bacterium]|nr:glycoside hydrolase family 3 C-terminal domain-containing protein [Dictyoglomaceae bacterium]